VEQVMANARARKLDALYLLTTTAENFFTRFGFAVTDRANVPKPIAATCEFREACPASAAVMVKSLTVPFKTV
jgi:amino-acid N-acetyltransferase